METQQNLIEIKDVYKWFPIKGGLFGKTLANVKAVDGVSLSVKKGETMGLVGESGSGKTTIGPMLMRLTSVTKGEISFDGNRYYPSQGTRSESPIDAECRWSFKILTPR